MRVYLIICFIDGLCEAAYEGGPQNPGGVATYGYRVIRDGKLLAEDSGVIGEGPGMTNIVAEYEALAQVLSYLVKMNMTGEAVEIRSDNKMLVNQMKGEWKVHGGAYLQYHDKARLLASNFPRISYKWVPRDSNAEADALTRKAYRQYLANRPHTKIGTDSVYN